LNSLIHLGLAYNQLSNASLAVITKNFPRLFCLDVQFNQLCDLSSALGQIEKLSDLKVLYLAGNPLALSYKYREIAKQSLIDLRFFDGTPAFTEAEENLKKKAKKKFLKQQQQNPGLLF